MLRLFRGMNLPITHISYTKNFEDVVKMTERE